VAVRSPTSYSRAEHQVRRGYHPCADPAPDPAWTGTNGKQNDPSW